MQSENTYLVQADSLGPCDCYKCTEPEYGYHDGHRFIKNNLLRHTLLEACWGCGRPKTEYHDAGTKGYFTCWWCDERAAENVTVDNLERVDAIRS